MIERLSVAIAARLNRREALAGLGAAAVAMIANAMGVRARNPMPEGFRYYCCALCRPHSTACQTECPGYLYWWRCPYMRWTFLCVECFTGDNGSCWGCDMAYCSYYVQEA